MMYKLNKDHNKFSNGLFGGVPKLSPIAVFADGSRRQSLGAKSKFMRHMFEDTGETGAREDDRYEERESPRRRRMSSEEMREAKEELFGLLERIFKKPMRFVKESIIPTALVLSAIDLLRNLGNKSALVRTIVFDDKTVTQPLTGWSKFYKALELTGNDILHAIGSVGHFINQNPVFSALMLGTIGIAYQLIEKGRRKGLGQTNEEATDKDMTLWEGVKHFFKSDTYINAVLRVTTAIILIKEIASLVDHLLYQSKPYWEPAAGSLIGMAAVLFGYHWVNHQDKALTAARKGLVGAAIMMVATVPIETYGKAKNMLRCLFDGFGRLKEAGTDIVNLIVSGDLVRWAGQAVAEHPVWTGVIVVAGLALWKGISEMRGANKQREIQRKNATLAREQEEWRAENSDQLNSDRENFKNNSGLN